MDVLLQQQVQQLPDERMELFALMDRFSSVIGKFQKEFSANVRSKEKDLQTRKTDMENTLSKLQSDHKAKKAMLDNQHATELRSIEDKVTACKKRASADLTLQDSLVIEKEQELRTQLAELSKRDVRTARTYSAVRDKISEIINNVRVALGQTSKGVHKLDRIAQTFKLESTVKNHSAALNAVEQQKVEDAKALYDEILRITESLPKRIIFNKKRTALIKDLMQSELDAITAVQILEDEIKQEQLRHHSQANEELRAFREQSGKQKQKTGAERDRILAGLKTERTNAEKKYAADSSRMITEQQQAFDQTKASHTKQISDADARWKAQLLNCAKTFQVNMEKTFPAKKMQEWLIQFWRHPDKVENYAGKNNQLNTLIGIAEVDVSTWFAGPTGSVIAKVLQRYLLLFGTNKKWIQRSYAEKRIYLPYSISIEKGTSVHISCADGTEERGKKMLNAFSLRMLRSVPACQMQFQLIDHTGISVFGPLLSVDPAAVVNPSEPIVKSIADNGKVYSTVQEISQQIAHLKTTMGTLSKNLAGCPSIRHFNRMNPLSKQIYRPVLMMNFPQGLNALELQTLQALHQDCASWGFSMILVQPDSALNGLKPELLAKVKELSSDLLCLRINGPQEPIVAVNSKSPVERSARIRMFGMPDADMMKQVAQQYRKESVEASRIQINFTGAKSIYPEPSEWFKESAVDAVMIPVGYLEGGQPLQLQFDDVQHVHTMIMGDTGSGKTNLLHVIMANLMLRYKPEEVQIYLIDFKYGLDFRIYTRFYLPNFKAISVTSDPEFAVSILSDLADKINDRSAKMDSKYQKISEFNSAQPQQKMGRIILIVDELYELVKRAKDDVQKNILGHIDSFAHQMRAFGLHLVICGQDLDKIEGIETVMSQCSTRIAMHCSDDQVKWLLGDKGSDRMRSIDNTDVGACVVSLGKRDEPKVERTTYIGGGQLETILTQVHEHYIQAHAYPKPKVLLTKVSDDPNHPIQLFVSQGIVPDNPVSRLMIGEPISMERSLNLCPEGNVWIAGGYQTERSMDAAESLLFFVGVSLMLAKFKYGNSEIICTNCADSTLRSIDEEEKDYIGQLTSQYPKLFRYYKADQVRVSLKYLIGELDARRNGQSNKKAIWWLLLLPEMASNLANDANFIIELKEMLTSAHEQNIHVILWTAYPKKAETLQIDGAAFKDKVCLEMGNEDFKTVLGTQLKDELSDYKAIHIGSNRMRFHIYEMPDGQWMNRLHERIKRFQ